MSFGESTILEELASTDTGISPELRKFVDEARLAKNFAEYPEMQIELTAEQENRVGLIRAELFTLPLIHGTKQKDVGGDGAGIVPSSELPSGAPSNTYDLDKSVGLDKYAFFSWGFVGRSQYGANFLEVSPSVVTSQKTIVTPCDIGQFVFADDAVYDKLPDEKKARLERNYFSKIVKGKDWVEILARRILKAVESGKSFFELSSMETMGEIKHNGTVPSDAIVGRFTSGEMKQYWKFLYEHGFSFSNLEHDRDLYSQTGDRGNQVDKFPEDYGIDYEKCATHWRKLLNI